MPITNINISYFCCSSLSLGWQYAELGHLSQPQLQLLPFFLSRTILRIARKTIATKAKQIKIVGQFSLKKASIIPPPPIS